MSEIHNQKSNTVLHVVTETFSCVTNQNPHLASGPQHPRIVVTSLSCGHFWCSFSSCSLFTTKSWFAICHAIHQSSFGGDHSATCLVTLHSIKFSWFVANLIIVPQLCCILFIFVLQFFARLLINFFFFFTLNT